MIDIVDKSKCCGCNACVQCCPKQCITMSEDEEGFLYPSVNKNFCIECGKCEKICPILNQAFSKDPYLVFAAKNENEKQRLKSSSGGIFIILAEHIIKQGGVVFGARFDSDHVVVHTYAETLEELGPLMRSKYVQSQIRNTYNQAKQFLVQGRKVLFVGTPCQIAGLKNFLRKDYDNLLAVDFICHGVPSPGIWREYLKEVKSSFTKKSPSIPISDINFREKQLGGYSWKKYGFVISSMLFPNDDKEGILLSVPSMESIYMRGFLFNLYLRPSCHACPVKAGRSSSDLTIGDFWGIDKIKSEIDDDKGIGALLVYTKKGENFLEEVKIQLFPMRYSDVTRFNSSVYLSVPVPQKRKVFWMQYEKTQNVHKSVLRTLNVTLKEKIKTKINILLKKR